MLTCPRSCLRLLPDAHHHVFLTQQLGLVWDPLLKVDPDGPTIIFHAALMHGFQFISNPFPRICSAPFFFVSTEMTGWPSVKKLPAFLLMYSN